MNLSELKLNPNNPRFIKDEKFKKLVHSIKQDDKFTAEMMKLRPIVIDDQNMILAGNMRYRAFLELGKTEIPDEWIKQASEMTAEQRQRFIVEDNLAFGETDYDILANNFEVADLLEWGFDEKDLKIDMPIEEDDVPEVPEEAKSKLGEIYQLGEHRLMCGDATKLEDVEKLMDGQKADMVFTDPPYGMNLDTDYSKMEGNGRKGKTYSKVIGDNEDFKDDLINTVFDNFNYCDEIFLWGVDYYFDLIPNFKDGNLIVWDKTLQTNGDAGYNSEFELLWTKNQHKKEVIHFNWFRYLGLSAQDMKTREHPTQKPLQVITPFIEKYSKENNLIVDIYGGSGTTLIACEQLNRKCYMMELDCRYIQVILDRWSNFTGQDPIRLNDGKKWSEIKLAQ